MNCALIFAGGTGQRMHSTSRPKQFLEHDGKPVIIHTVSVFDSHPGIDAIVIVCLEGWIDYLTDSLDAFGIGKVVDVVRGGATGQESIRAGIERLEADFPPETTVLVHDGVRPLIDHATIDACIESVAVHGSAITVTPAIETIVCAEEGRVIGITDRSTCVMARAPQCFLLGDLAAAHHSAVDEGLGDFIDCASLMRHFGHELFVIEGSPDNIKITTPSDFHAFQAMYDARHGK